MAHPYLKEKGGARRKTFQLEMEETLSSGKLDPVLALGSGVWDSGSHSTVSCVTTGDGFPSETLTEGQEDRVTGLSAYKEQVLESGSTSSRRWRRPDP